MPDSKTGEVTNGVTWIRRVSRALAAGAALLATVMGAAPVHAAQPAADDSCSPWIGTMSSDRYTNVQSKSCLSDYGGTHGYFVVACQRGTLTTWVPWACRVLGDYEILDSQNNVVKSDRFTLDYRHSQPHAVAEFRFSCEGRPHGEYTLNITRAVGWLTNGYEHYQDVRLRDTTVTRTMC
ncbi:hypothetical protein ACFW5I_24585 [Streptomyces sp. NPDC058818]|uniref:hypothetical protein n=1 Tax=Streptomyces sp. NPDC058818 TaxID=3346640 RepID=UPI00368FC90B